MNLLTDAQTIIEDSIFEHISVVHDKIESLCQTYFSKNLLRDFIVSSKFKELSNDSEIKIFYKTDKKYSAIAYTIAVQ